MNDCCYPSLAATCAHCGLCCTKVNNLSVAKGKKTIIHDICLHIHCGELTAIIGPNGGGKSTFLKAIIGELAFKGEITFLSRGEKNRRRPLVGYVPQRGEFDPGSPVSVEDLFLSRYLRKPLWIFSSSQEREKTLKSLSIVEAEHLIDRRLGELSGGEVQRVLLALAMEPVPELLLLDEPVSGVDYSGRKLFYKLVSDFRKQYDLSILMVSHDIELMGNFADRMVFLDKTILCQGTPDEVLENELVIQSFGLKSLEKNHQLSL
ncbi:metal ABC transporter ATP-binding protein [Dehalobacterium formicoaceticum]|uniref:Metal ABC transporter ATP-binding protein n=2 Tax=Dehalobacterium formicoaceticum TaxID=51515 RepID=A0ABT1XZN6_9FIRM|nr:metal ABC transporter ATP-binding protein [Dehalobacterium formicoaceticum]MCR6544083.1 metal ABC transporter ATP-binding protein [Dehalobacterium formicoaceticum]